jgi:hypothetical protein
LKMFNIISLLKKCLDTTTDTAVMAAAAADDDNNTKQDDIDTARTAFFNTVGNANPLLVAPMINPVFTGGPNWPTRPSWKWIDLDDSGGVVWATNGLADPWSNPEMFGNTPPDFNLDTGLGIEVLLGCSKGDLDKDVLRQAITSVTYGLARNPFLLNMLQACNRQNKELLGGFNFEMEGCLCPPMSTTGNAALPAEMLVENAQFGVLIVQGLSCGPTFETPHGTIQVLEIVLLYPHELEWILVCGDPARVEMLRRLKTRKESWPSSPSRKPLVAKNAEIPTDLPEDPVERIQVSIRVIQETWPADDESTA